MMKKIIYLISTTLLFTAGSLYAQKERIEYLPNFDKRTLHFGYYLGLNSVNYKFDYKDPYTYTPIPPENKELAIAMDNAYGFNIGFVVDLRLSNNINLRLEPGLLSNAAKIEFLNANIGPENPDYNGTSNTERTITATYLHIPLLLKFSTNRLNNIRPYIIGGASYDYNFSSNQDNSMDNYDGQYRTTTHNFMYEVGLGMEFYFYFFKFSPSIRGIFAINDQLVRDFKSESPWTGPIDHMGLRGIYLNLTFE